MQPVRLLSSSVTHLNGQSALQGKWRCPSSLLVFWVGPAIPAWGRDAGRGTPRRGPAETAACQPERSAGKRFDFGASPSGLATVECFQGGHSGWRFAAAVSAVVYYEIITQLGITRMPGEASAASASLQITSAAPV